MSTRGMNFGAVADPSTYPVPEHKKLNLGSGFKKLEDHWNVDISSRSTPDQVWDLEVMPWPWDADFFTAIRADNSLEHLGQTPRAFAAIIQEMYRVSADGAEWVIVIPHHRCDAFWDDFTHVRVLTEKTFKMFDQKVNYEALERKLSDSAFGFQYGIDLEVLDVTYDLVGYWSKLRDEGMIGPAQLNINMNTMANVAEVVNIFIKVHKPGRYQTWIETNFK